MNLWLEMALSNALIAGLMAIIAALVTRFVRNPHVAHFAWVLVLLKLVTPPVVSWPIATLPIVIQDSRFASTIFRDDGATNSRLVSEGTAEPSGPVGAGTQTGFANDTTENAVPAPGELPKANSRGDFLERVFSGVGLERIAVAAWISGSFFWCALLVMRIARFHRLVTAAVLASDSWQQVTREIATSLGVHRAFQLRTAAGVFPPLLWVIGRQRAILIPQPLFDDLTTDARRAVIAHELAHYARRDHWVRWLEMIALGLYWWYPVTWWARRRLLDAEEQCCDALAAHVSGQQPRAYGQALLAVIDFLADRPAMRPLPVSGMARSTNLQRRFEMLVSGAVSERRSRLLWTAFVGAVAVLVPLSIHLASADENAPAEKTQAEKSPTVKPQQWARLSPFTEMRIDGDVIHVQFDKKPYDLVSIDGIGTAQLRAAAQKHYPEIWEKRLIEDLVEVMEHAGKRPGATVKLVLRDPRSGTESVVDQAPMTTANRNLVYNARMREGMHDRERKQLGKLAPTKEDEKQIAALVAAFVDSAEKGDVAAVGKLLVEGHPNAEERTRNYIKDTKSILLHLDPRKLQSILIDSADRALAVTDFFKSERNGMELNACIVYHCERVNGQWLIHDIDGEDVSGLVAEIGRHVAKEAQRQQATK